MRLVPPMGSGYVEGTAHDHVRHSTMPMFAALDLGNGQVISHARIEHRDQKSWTSCA